MLPQITWPVYCLIFVTLWLLELYYSTMFHALWRLTHDRARLTVAKEKIEMLPPSMPRLPVFDRLPANRRLIAGKIECESRFPPWIKNSRLLFKIVCRCFQIWQEKVLDVAQTNLCAVPSPLNCETPCRRSQFLMNSTLSWFLFRKYHFTVKCCRAFCWLHRVLSMRTRKCTGLSLFGACEKFRCLQHVIRQPGKTKTSDYPMEWRWRDLSWGILKRAKTERLIAVRCCVPKE